MEHEEILNIRNSNPIEAQKTNPTKWYIGIVAIGMIALLGMMLASVVVGSKLTEEVYIGNHNELLTTKGGTPVKTSAALFSHPLSIRTPLSVLEGIHSVDLNITVEGSPALYHLQIVSFVLVPNKKLTLYGNTHQVEILADGTLTLFPLTTELGKRSFEEPITATTTSATCTSSCSASATSTAIIISTCADLQNIQDPTSSCALAADLNCTLSGPLCAGKLFTGTFDGAGYYLGLNMNCEGNAGLFDQFAGTILNLNIHGNIQGTQYVGAFGAQIHGGSVKSCGSYATVTCSAKAGSNFVAGAGGFFGFGKLDNAINFHSCVSQGNVQCSGSPVANTAGGYVGCHSSHSTATTSLNFDTCLSVPVSLQGQHCDAFSKLIAGHSQVCSGNNCGANLQCQTCYYNEFAGDCACSASQVPNHELCCPNVLYANNVIFHYTCAGNTSLSSSSSSSSSNTIHPIYPASPGTCGGSPVQACTKNCFFGTHCVNNKCVPGPWGWRF